MVRKCPEKHSELFYGEILLKSTKQKNRDLTCASDCRIMMPKIGLTSLLEFYSVASTKNKTFYTAEGKLRLLVYMLFLSSELAPHHLDQPNNFHHNPLTFEVR